MCEASLLTTFRNSSWIPSLLVTWISSSLLVWWFLFILPVKMGPRVNSETSSVNSLCASCKNPRSIVPSSSGSSGPRTFCETWPWQKGHHSLWNQRWPNLPQWPIQRLLVRQSDNKRLRFMPVLTQHLVLCNIQTCNSKAGISIGVISVDWELPVVNSTWETHAAKGYSVLVTLTRYCAVVLWELQLRWTKARVKCEPGHYNNTEYSVTTPEASCSRTELLTELSKQSTSLGDTLAIKRNFIFWFVYMLTCIYARVCVWINNPVQYKLTVTLGRL